MATTIQILFTATILGVSILGVGSIWNLSVNREPYLTISGLMGIGGAVIALPSLIGVVLVLIWTH